MAQVKRNFIHLFHLFASTFEASRAGLTCENLGHRQQQTTSSNKHMLVIYPV